jgi:hypothetical protein
MTNTFDREALVEAYIDRLLDNNLHQRFAADCW